MKHFYLFTLLLTYSLFNYTKANDNFLFNEKPHLLLNQANELSYNICLHGDTIKKDSTKNKKTYSENNYNNSNINWGNLNGTGELLPYIAIGIVVVGAVIVSNDVVYYRSYSFQDQKINGQVLKFSNTLGHTIGLRKTFNHSAIECYGTQFQSFDAMSLINTTYQNKKYYGLQLNYTQQFLYKKTSERLKFYAGPSINYLNDLGYGGIAGVEYKIIDRLKFDLRYELTTQTNLVRAGLIFTYQKKSPWEF